MRVEFYIIIIYISLTNYDLLNILWSRRRSQSILSWSSSHLNLIRGWWISTSHIRWWSRCLLIWRWWRSIVFVQNFTSVIIHCWYLSTFKCRIILVKFTLSNHNCIFIIKLSSISTIVGLLMLDLPRTSLVHRHQMARLPSIQYNCLSQGL